MSLVALPLIALAMLTAIPAISPAAGAATADFLRSIFGPAPVAQLESLSYSLRDAINRSPLAARTGGPLVTWSNTADAHSETAVSQPTPMPDPQIPVLNPVSTAGPGAAALASQTQDPQADDVLTALPQIGWQEYVPFMTRAMLMVDPDRSYAGVALVRISLSALKLHIMAGFLEPAHPSGIGNLIPDLGMVPPQDLSKLAAAFNGGFKALHGHYGMMVSGITLLPPVDGLETVAVYQDGSVRLGTWGTDLFASPDMVAFRQNCPPLLDAGRINPALSTDARKSWGFTNNSDVTWRTGLGITQDRRFLLYAVGNGTTAQFLAEALLRAGAYAAMQLDINQYYAHFVTYSSMESPPNSAGGQLTAQPLLDKMIDVHSLFLVPYPRDFFYLTLLK